MADSRRHWGINRMTDARRLGSKNVQVTLCCHLRCPCEHPCSSRPWRFGRPARRGVCVPPSRAKARARATSRWGKCEQRAGGGQMKADARSACSLFRQEPCPDCGCRQRISGDSRAATAASLRPTRGCGAATGAGRDARHPPGSGVGDSSPGRAAPPVAVRRRNARIRAWHTGSRAVSGPDACAPGWRRPLAVVGHAALRHRPGGRPWRTRTRCLRSRPAQRSRVGRANPVAGRARRRSR